MEKFKTFIWSQNGYFAVVASICLIAFFGFIAASALIENSRAKKVNSQVNTQSNQAAEAKQTAINANAQAVSSAIERKIEDNRRTETITPKLEAARKQSQNSKSELEKAKGKYESEKSNSQNLNSSRAANCADLRRLFPGIEFEDCR